MVAAVGRRRERLPEPAPACALPAAEVSRCIPTSLRIPRSGGAVNHHLPADLILGLSHHKTGGRGGALTSTRQQACINVQRLSFRDSLLLELGTSQMGCMLYAIAESAGLPTPLYMVGYCGQSHEPRQLLLVAEPTPAPVSCCCYVERRGSDREYHSPPCKRWCGSS